MVQADPVGLEAGWYLGFVFESCGCCDCEGVGCCVESLLINGVGGLIDYCSVWESFVEAA